MSTVNINNTTAQPVYYYNQKSLGIAYLLLFVLGIFGVHQFYLGKVGRGIGYLLTCGWFTIALWIDLFTLPAQTRQVNLYRRNGVR